MMNMSPSVIVTSFAYPFTTNIYDAIDEAIAIQNEFAIAQELIAKGKTEAENGVLISSYSPKHALEQIEQGGVLYLAREQKSHRSLGYLFQLTGKQFHDKFKGGHVEWGSAIFAQRYDESFKSGDFIYLNQIGVRLEFHGSGISSLLLSAFEQQLRGSLIVSSVMRAPLRNPRSKYFFNKHGYENAGLLFKKVFGGFNKSNSYLLTKDLR